jgi:putative beta-lysine N-acetyltransferase
MYDKAERMGHSMIHHGSCNNRIYVMAYDNRDEAYMINWLDLLARNKGYSKIIAKLPEQIVYKFIQDQFKKEGEIPGYYKGKETCYFLSKYMDADRACVEDKLLIEDVIEVAKNKHYTALTPPLGKDFTIREMMLSDADNMAELYRQVFETYPFPICDPNYQANHEDSCEIFWCRMPRRAHRAILL